VTSTVDGLWVIQFDGITGKSSGVAAFMNNRIYGGDSGHTYLGCIATEGAQVGGYFVVRNFVPNYPNTFGGGAYIELHLGGKLVGNRIQGELRSSKLPAKVLASVELRKKTDFLAVEGHLNRPDHSAVLIQSDESLLASNVKIGGFWTIEVESVQRTSAGVLFLVNGSVFGGDSGFTFVGTTQTKGGISARLLVDNFSPEFPNLFGYFGNCEVDLDLTELSPPGEMSGKATVLHRPDMTGKCRLRKKAELPLFTGCSTR
jgi:hypothetical protein